MNAQINEVFSSIQGEGKLIGRRQIFVRFSGCNLECNYCDTPQGKDPNACNSFSTEKLYNTVDNLLTPDFHSISFTGGEPLLYADFIKEFLETYNFNSLLETNGSMPNQLKKIADLIKYCSLDIKLPEHKASKNYEKLFKSELDSLNVLIDRGINTYCKVVVLPSTNVDMISSIASRLQKEISDISKLSMVIQPADPLSQWEKGMRLFEISENAGKYIDVLTIPQVHKILRIR
ncbi:7-carboxy-7-deazaguanine synthase QueE [Methanobacterium sp. ACI-7]|uniref:7-carboxy-7-deazaguanine synthase QueE n=1 Tax=unclassified Methanobacterium TaxID=2627676 RepID=UPI0039C048E6